MDSSHARIIGIDLGKFNSVACVHVVATGQQTFASVQTTPQALHDLLVEHRSPSGTTLLVIETCDVAGGVHDLARSLDIDVPGPSATTSTNPRWARERLHDAANEAWPVVSGE
jgi:hypothetical protein